MRDHIRDLSLLVYKVGNWDLGQESSCDCESLCSHELNSCCLIH